MWDVLMFVHVGQNLISLSFANYCSSLSIAWNPSQLLFMWRCFSSCFPWYLQLLLLWWNRWHHVPVNFWCRNGVRTPLCCVYRISFIVMWVPLMIISTSICVTCRSTIDTRYWVSVFFHPSPSYSSWWSRYNPRLLHQINSYCRRRRFSNEILLSWSGPMHVRLYSSTFAEKSLLLFLFVRTAFSSLSDFFLLLCFLLVYMMGRSILNYVDDRIKFSRSRAKVCAEQRRRRDVSVKSA